MRSNASFSEFYLFLFLQYFTKKNLDLAFNICRPKFCSVYNMSGWPSGLRRQTQGKDPFSVDLRILVLE